MKKFLAVFLVAVFVLSVGFATNLHAETPIPINEARAKTLGETVTVQGIITVKPGTFDKGFALQDDTGGIYVYPSDKVNYNIGDEVIVTGELANYNGLLEIKSKSSDIKLVAHKTCPEPKLFKTGDIGEESDGWLVKVSGVVKSKKDYYFYIDDDSGKCEVYIKKYVHIDLSSISVGEELTVVGFSSKYKSYYEILPRSSEDITKGIVVSVPGTPKNVEASITPDLTVLLKWQSPADNGGASVSAYKLYKGTEPGKETLLTTVNDTQYEDKDVKEGDTYYYYVTAVNSQGEGAHSEEISVNIELLLYPPTNLKAEVSGNKVKISWDAAKKGKNDIAGYAIYCGEEQGAESEVPIAVVDANITEYEDTDVKFGKTYYYVVKTFDSSNPPNYSAPSNEVKVELKDTIPPVVTVKTPNDFEAVNDNTVTVSGTATDDLSGISKVTVNGNNVSISADGSFNTLVTLTEGENTITIVAEDKAGNKATKTIIVTYQPTIVITLQIGNPNMTVNGVSQEIDPGRGTKPVIIKEWGRTVVPIRAIVEALGGTIGWNGKERKVTINLKDTVIELWIGKPKAKVNGIEKWIDPNNHNVKPIIVNQRTMLPLRFVAENLGCTVNWNSNTRTITIIYEP